MAADLRGAVDLILDGTAAYQRRLAVGRRRTGRPGAACWSPAPTRPATCCSPARRSGPSRPAPTRVVLLCGPRGRAAAELLPGVDEIVEWRLPWIDPRPAGGRPRRRRAGWSPGSRRPRPTRRSSSPRSTSRRCRSRCCCGWPACRPDQPRSATTTRARCWTCGTGCRRASRRPSGRCRWPRRPASPCRPATTGGCASVRRPARTSEWRRPAAAPLRRRPSRAASACRPGPARPALCAGIVAALAAAGHRVVVTGGPGRAAALTAYVAGEPRRRPRRAHRPVAGWRPSSPAPTAWWSATPARRTWPRPSARRWSASSPRPSRSGSGGRTGCRPCASATPDAAVPGHPGHRSARCPAIPACRHRAGRRRRRGGPAVRGAGMNILLWHVHGSWTTAFVQGKHRYLVPVTPDRGAVRPRPGAHLPVAGHRGGGRAGASCGDAEVDVVVLQRPEELDLARRWLAPPAPADRLRRAQHPQGRRAGHPAPDGRPRRPACSSTSPTSTSCSGTPAAPAPR